MRVRGMPDFGAIARERRRDLGLSQQDLATRAGVTRQWLVRFEQGNAEVALSKVYAVLGQLGLTVRLDPAERQDIPMPEIAIPRIDPSRLAMESLRQSRSKIDLADLRARIRELDAGDA